MLLLWLFSGFLPLVSSSTSWHQGRSASLQLVPVTTVSVNWKSAEPHKYFTEKVDFHVNWEDLQHVRAEAHQSSFNKSPSPTHHETADRLDWLDQQPQAGSPYLNAEPRGGPNRDTVVKTESTVIGRALFLVSFQRSFTLKGDSVNHHVNDGWDLLVVSNPTYLQVCHF